MDGWVKKTKVVMKDGWKEGKWNGWVKKTKERMKDDGWEERWKGMDGFKIKEG